MAFNLVSLQTLFDSYLLVIFISVIVNNVEESELIDTLACRNDSQPISQLLLLQELLGPTIISLILTTLHKTHKYLRYRPEKGMCATTSIFPSPACEMVI